MPRGIDLAKEGPCGKCGYVGLKQDVGACSVDGEVESRVRELYVVGGAAVHVPLWSHNPPPAVHL